MAKRPRIRAVLVRLQSGAIVSIRCRQKAKVERARIALPEALETARDKIGWNLFGRELGDEEVLEELEIPRDGHIEPRIDA
jgi:hypothetical protein